MASEPAGSTAQTSPTYAVILPNPYYQPDAPEKQVKIPISKAKKHLYDILNIAQKPSTDERSHFEKLLDSRISWLKPDATGDITQGEFLADVEGTVIWILRNHLGLNANLSVTKDESQIICLLTASEGILRKFALEMEYELTLNQPSDPNYAFTRVPPCQGVLDNTPEWWDSFVHYDNKGKPSETGETVFRPVDCIKIIARALNENFDILALLKYGVVLNHMPVHDREELAFLKANWASFKRILTPQPITRLRNYLGEKMTMYYAWLGYNVKMLFLPSLIGLIVATTLLLIGWNNEETSWDNVLLVSFAAFMSIWSTTNEQLWLRKQNEYVWKWDMTTLEEEEELRAEYDAEIVPDPISGRHRKERAGFHHILRQSISYGVMLTFMGIVMASVSAIFIYKASKANDPDWARICGLINAAQIWLLNKIYTIVANKMTDWENHETEESYLDSLSVRLFCFRFINSYISLFYISFFKGRIITSDPCLNDSCMEELSTQLSSIFVFTMVLNLVEMGMPVIFWYLRHGRSKPQAAASTELTDMASGQTPMVYRHSDVEDELALDAYGLPVEDYLEIVINYGYMVLFSVSYPIIPLLTLIEYVVEIRVDAWKLLSWAHRPFPLPGKSIGVFSTIIEIMSYFGAITNPALIIFTTGYFKETPLFRKIVVFLLVEHGLVMLKFVLAWLIPDESKTVADGIKWGERIREERLVKLKGGKQERDELSSILQGEDFKLDPNRVQMDDDF